MELEERFGFRMTLAEARALQRLAEAELRNRGQFLRVLIRRVAKEEGMWLEAELKQQTSQEAA